MFKGIHIIFTVILLLSCSGRHDRDAEDLLAGSVDSPLSGPRPQFVKLVSSRELLDYFGVATNYSPGMNTAIRNEFSNLYPTLPQNGDSDFSSQTSRMFTNFAMRCCLGSVTAEAALPATNRVAFKYINLSQRPDLVTDNDLEARAGAFIRSLAFRFYGAAIPEDEYETVFQFYRGQRNLVTQDAAGAQDLAAQICALLGSSPRSLMRR